MKSRLALFAALFSIILLSNNSKADWELKFDATEETEIVPAYQIITGMSYESEDHPSVQLDVGYGSVATVGGPLYKNDTYNYQDYEVDGHSIAAGIRIKF